MKAEECKSSASGPHDAAVDRDVANTLPCFNKRAILKHLQKFGSGELKNVLSRHKYSEELVIDYLNEILSKSEQCLHEECGSFCFNTIQAWLFMFEQASWLYPLEPFADYIGEIADMEDLPSPSELNGVDLREVYKFIRNGMLGLPQPKINSQTMEFLVREMEALIESVNTEEGDQEAYSMHDKLEQGLHLSGIYDFNKMDPLGLG